MIRACIRCRREWSGNSRCARRDRLPSSARRSVQPRSAYQPRAPARRAYVKIGHAHGGAAVVNACCAHEHMDVQVIGRHGAAKRLRPRSVPLLATTTTGLSPLKSNGCVTRSPSSFVSGHTRCVGHVAARQLCKGVAHLSAGTHGSAPSSSFSASPMKLRGVPLIGGVVKACGRRAPLRRARSCCRPAGRVARAGGVDAPHQAAHLGGLRARHRAGIARKVIAPCPARFLVAAATAPTQRAACSAVTQLPQQVQADSPNVGDLGRH